MSVSSAVLVIMALTAAAAATQLTTCPSAGLQCARGYIDDTACATKPCSSYGWDRTTRCTCPPGYGGAACNFVVNATACPANQTMKAVPRGGDGQMECSVVYSDQSKILNLIDQRSSLHVDLANDIVTFQAQTRLNRGGSVCGDVQTLLECTFSQCLLQPSPSGDVLSCSKKKCLACDNCGYAILNLFVSLLNADRNPLTFNFSPPDATGSVVANLQLQTWLYTLPLTVNCLTGFCAAA